jgi:hypothetical protein
MFIIYEYATCVLAVVIGATLLFAACVMYLVFKEGCTILAQSLQKLTHGTTGLMGRWASESREP